MKKMYLNSDIRSTCKPSVTYGLQGEQVCIISISNNVLVVENMSGNRFPVHEKELVEETPTMIEGKQVFKNNNVVPKKTRKVTTSQTPSLF